MSTLRVDNITNEAGTDTPVILFDNTTSGLTATDIKAAIDELKSDLDTIDLSATSVTYDNTTSGLTATNVKAALDELASRPSDQLVTTNWTVEQSGTDLIFKYSGVNKMKLTSNGDIIVSGNITAFGSP